MTHPEYTPVSPDSRERREKRRPLAPDPRTLEDRSARAWTEAMAVRPIGRGRYAVESQSGETYLVDLPRSSCTCPDHEFRDERCKHLRRVAIEVTERRVPPPGAIEGECRICERETYVSESELPVCGDCWLERGDVAVDRETGDTVVVYRLTDDRADERLVDGSETTVADYPRNDGYPSDDPVVEVVYPFSGDPGTDLEDLRRYAFPYSRLSVRDQMLVE